MTPTDFFEMIDINKDGELQLSEMKDTLGMIGDFKVKEIHSIYSFFDIDGNGSIDKREFIMQLNKAKNK